MRSSALRGVLVVVGMLCAFSTQATENDAIVSLKRTLQQRYPSLAIQDIRPAPVAGLYEIVVGSSVVYSDPTGDHVLLGRLIETKSGRDLSAERLDEYKGIDFTKLPLDQSIRIVKGNGSRRIAAFEDPDCPYCQALEKEFSSLDDVTIYVFLLPLENLHPGATEHARAIWCAADPPAAWSEWVLHRTAPPAAPCDKDPISTIRGLAKEMRVKSTPTLFVENGHRISGTHAATQLEQLLREAAAAPKPFAALTPEDPAVAH